MATGRLGETYQNKPMRFTTYGEPSDREIDARRLPPYCPQCEEPAENYDELCQDCQDMNPHSTHPSQDQDGKDSAFTAATAELFKPLPTIEQIKDKLKEWIRMAEEATPGPWEFGIESGQAFLSSKNHSITGVLDIDLYKDDTDAGLSNLTFIATSRTAAPLTWKALLNTLEILEVMSDKPGSECFHTSASQELIQSLREQFKPIFHSKNR